MKRIIALLLLCLLGCQASEPTSRVDAPKDRMQATRFDHGPIQARITQRLNDGDFTNLMVESYDQMFALAQTLMTNAGHGDEAALLKNEWEGRYRNLMAGKLEDVGDHKPLSEWVNEWYTIIYNLLGETVMTDTHLKDIWILNFTVPVVFHPQASNAWCTEQLSVFPEDTCEAEYRRHFAGTRWQPFDPYASDEYTHDGFSGVVAYWVTWGACEVATYGTGWFLVCTPAGDLVEDAIEKWVAPKLSNRIYERANP